MREPVTLRAVVPRGAPAGMRGALVIGAGEQLREQDRQHEIAGGVGVRAGGRAQSEQQQRAQVACGRALRQPRVAPGT